MTNIDKVADELMQSHNGSKLLAHLKQITSPFTYSSVIMSGDQFLLFARFISSGIIEITNKKVLGTPTYRIADKYNV